MAHAHLGAASQYAREAPRRTCMHATSAKCSCRPADRERYPTSCAASLHFVGAFPPSRLAAAGCANSLHWNRRDENNTYEGESSGTERLRQHSD